LITPGHSRATAGAARQIETPAELITDQEHLDQILKSFSAETAAGRSSPRFNRLLSFTAVLKATRSRKT